MKQFNVETTAAETTRLKMINLFRVDENRIEQCFAAHIVQCCQQHCSALLHPIQAQQYCSVLLTTMNNVGSKTLFNPVFINPEQVDHFLPCTASTVFGHPPRMAYFLGHV